MDNNSVEKMTEQAPPPPAIIMQIGSGAMFTQALGVAAELGIADLIHEGRGKVNEMAAVTGAHERSLYRVLRSLASVGVFREISPRTFENTPVSETLRSGTPDSMRSTALFMAAPWHYNVFAEMKHSVMTGETAWEKTHGSGPFDWLQDRPAEAELFNNCMTELSVGAAPPVVEAYDFSGINTLADIAGGHGYLLSQILRANPSMRGILFDMEQVIAGADQTLEQHGVSERVEKMSGDFFEEVPAADAYIMKHIIHDWDDDRCVTILKNIHRAMTGDGKVLIVEMVVPEGNDPHPSKSLDLEMLASPGGLERTEGEYRDLYAAAGFRLNRIVPTKSPFSIIEGVKA
ncbi:MAG: methyltransferase [Pyrinomonadaceae bacterium]